MKIITQWITGFSIYGVLNWIFDYVFYGFAVWYFGIFYGGLLMAVIAFLLDWYSVKFYDNSETDWLAMESIKSLREYEGKNIFKRLTKFILTKTPKIVQIIFYSIKFNPFIATIMMRSDSFEYKGMSRQDWQVFIFTFVIGQVYWVLLISGALFVITSL